MRIAPGRSDEPLPPGGRVDARPVRRVEVACVLAFALCVLVVPPVFGDLYPFTIAPMFRDRPQVYCTYRVIGEDGRERSARDFELHRNYDGNPVGFGSGRAPPPTLDRFGEAPDEATVVAHVRRVLQARHPTVGYVDVIQTVIGPVDASRVDVIREVRLRVSRDD